MMCILVIVSIEKLCQVDTLCCAANVYSILPDSGWKHASVWIMLIHNISAFTLHTNPLLYMWERLIRTHHHPWYIRLPSRIPVCKPLLLETSLHGCFRFLDSEDTLKFACFACITQCGHWVVPLRDVECVWRCLYWQPHTMRMH